MIWSILDCGCGLRAKGTVNVDLHPELTEHRGEGGTIDVHGTPNFVKADIQHLPFKSDSFGEAWCSHVLEHVRFPELAISEMCRVARKVMVTVPHRFTINFGYWQKSHRHKFGAKWFRQMFRQLGISASMNVTYGLFGIPEQIIVEGTR